jgi:hypothetical protein
MEDGAARRPQLAAHHFANAAVRELHAVTVEVRDAVLHEELETHILACADDAKIIAENDEANNCAASSVLQVTAPDLMETAVGDPPPTAKIGTMSRSRTSPPAPTTSSPVPMT